MTQPAVPATPGVVRGRVVNQWLSSYSIGGNEWERFKVYAVRENTLSIVMVGGILCFFEDRIFTPIISY